MDKTKCCGQTHNFPPICYREPTIEVDGKFYCWQHDPNRRRQKVDVRKEQDRQRLIKLYAEISERHKVEQRLLLYKEMIQVISDSGNVSKKTAEDFLQRSKQIESYDVINELEEYEQRYLQAKPGE